MDDLDFDPLYQLLKEVQLEHFYNAIKSIDVTKVEHFENVLFDDLIGPQVCMGAPAARRLLEAAKKRNSNNKWKKNLFNIILPATNKVGKSDKDFGGSNLTNSNLDHSSSSSFEEKIVEKENIQHDNNVGLTCLIPNKDIKLLDKIGDGSFGVVMRASWTQPNKSVKYVAVKVLKQEVLSRALEDFAKEVNAMHQLKHQNLIKLYGIVLSSPMMMVTELAEQGSLRTKLVRTKGKLSLSTLVNYSFQIANGMDYLESKRLIHRDLATRNIFITGNDVIKIGDFGLMRSVPFDEEYYTMSDNMKVPFPWCALESLKYRQFSHASDTWMFGVTLWEIFSFGQEPWAGLNGSQIIRKLEQKERLAIPESCSKRIYQVMILCWNQDAKERPTFTALSRFFKTSYPIKLKAIQEFDNIINFHSKTLTTETETRKFLKLNRGDEVEVIEGQSENYWWKGQNQRTFEIGLFPRSVAKDLKNLNSNDISKPLKNSFIHTGHMDPLGKKSWGNPEFIEKMFLENPIEPQDLLGIDGSITDSDSGPTITVFLETRSGKKKNNLINEENHKEIEKIISLEELVNKNNSTEPESKEGVLIDFENEVNHVQVNSLLSNNHPQSNDNEMDINMNNKTELNEIKFNTQEILDLYKQKHNFPKPEETILLDNHLDSNKRIESIEETNSNQTSNDESSNASNKNSYSSKYYMPPFDSTNNPNASSTTNTSTTSKNRYYSSVCSNCDFGSSTTTTKSNPYPTLSSGQCESPIPFSLPPPPPPPPPSCQCCSFDLYNPCASHYFPTTTTSCFESNFFQHSNSTNLNCSMDNHFNLPSTTITDHHQFSSSSSTIGNNTTKKSAFQTKICKDFIDELEANFSKIGQMKKDNQESNLNSTQQSTVYPTINPPPKSYKTRRPAPPPPIQKKN